MAPQTSIPLAANILGTLGTTLWSVQLLPQIWHNWSKKTTDGLPAIMMFLFALSAVPFGVYAVVQNFNIPLQLQPHMYGSLSLVTWAQILMYHHGWKVWKAVAAAIGTAAIFAAIELALIFTIRGPYEMGVEMPITVIGVVATVVLALSLLPPYFEIWKRSGRVIGINWVFLSMDCSGAIISLIALLVQNTFDILGGILYLVVMVLELGIMTSHIIWLLRTRKLRHQARMKGIAFDDMPEAQKYQDKKVEKSVQSEKTASLVSVNVFSIPPLETHDDLEAAIEAPPHAHVVTLQSEHQDTSRYGVW